jgi:hypothetical protein
VWWVVHVVVTRVRLNVSCNNLVVCHFSPIFRREPGPAMPRV